MRNLVVGTLVILGQHRHRGVLEICTSWIYFLRGFRPRLRGKQLPLLHSLLCIGMKPSEDRLVYVHEFAISFQPVSVCTFLVSGVGVAAIY